MIVVIVFPFRTLEHIVLVHYRETQEVVLIILFLPCPLDFHGFKSQHNLEKITFLAHFRRALSPESRDG